MYTTIFRHDLEGGKEESVKVPDYAKEKIALTPNGRTVLEKRYLRKGENGQPLETINGMFYRIAKTVAEADSGGSEVPMLTRAFYELLSSLDFLPNSPTFTGAGTRLGQLAACFVLGIEDDLGKDEQGIFRTLLDAALIQQTGGGSGFSFSKLRPKGDFVRGSAGVASGPVSFLKVFDAAFGAIAQGGTRRGANMAVLRIDHPDIEEFITCKAQEGAITNFNISVAITDEFMECRAQGLPFHLINPRTGDIAKTVDPNYLMDLIAQYAHRNGEPGVLFVDRANDDNATPQLGDLEATNPCGEQFLLPYENCCLGSINLANMVKVEDGKTMIDWEKLGRTAHIATDFLDHVLDANRYVPAVPQLQEAAVRSRRIGLGVMGLADLMYMLGVRYGSNESFDLASQIMEFIEYQATMCSNLIAGYKGVFGAYDGSIYDYKKFQWQAPKPTFDQSGDWGRPNYINWEGLTRSIKLNGIRNSVRTTIAPTGTIATVAGIEGYGCEPVFALGYTRHFKDGDKDVELQYISPLFQKALDETDLDAETKQRILAQVCLTGSCQGIEELPESIRNTFVVSGDLDMRQHIQMQAALQAFVGNSISKTCNAPEGTTVEEVKRAYAEAWVLGCKGLTVYVTGSRDQVVLETQATKQKKETERPAEPCPSCQGPTYIVGGCIKCKDPQCGFSACSI